MKCNPVDGVVYSKWEREELKKPKVLNEDEEPVDDEDEEAKKLDEASLVKRSCDLE